MYDNDDFVNCINCKNFIPADAQYEENSMGTCLVMKTWLDKFPNRRPKPEIYDRNYAKLGGKTYYPYVDRYCQRFEIKKALLEQGLNDNMNIEESSP